ncbi:DNA primase [soil metagenome]
MPPFAQFDHTEIDRVLAATDIVRVISMHMAVKKKGREYVCLCPFHNDHSPSMTISPGKQIYKCFSCGAGGDALKFVREYHKMAFGEALQYLADQAGIALAPPKPMARTPSGSAGRGASAVAMDAGDLSQGAADDEPNAGAGVSRDQLAHANRTAADFYRLILRNPEHGGAARAILERRGVSAAMIEQFQLGAAPDRWDGLALLVASKRLDPKPFFAAGLIRARTGGDGAFDAQRNRVIFPIFDQLARVIGFGGRRINDADEPKYINSSDSALFNKSATLYGLNFAADEIRRTKEAVVVEGYMDAIACHQAGVTNVVATLGTALTPQSARVLGRFAERVVLFFDGDEAGQRAADRAVEVFFSSSIDVRIATLSGTGGGAGKAASDAKDPDELVKRPGGVETLRALIAQSTDALEYRFARMRANLTGAGMTQRATAVNEELQHLSDLGLARLNPVRRQLVIRRIADLTGVNEETIRQSLRETKPGRTRREEDEGGGRAAAESGPMHPISQAEHALAFLLAEPLLLAGLDDEGKAALVRAGAVRPEIAGIAGAVVGLTARGAADTAPGALAAALRRLDDRAQEIAAGFMLSIETRYRGDGERLQADFAGAVQRAVAADLDRRAGEADVTLSERIALHRRAQTLRAAARGVGEPPASSTRDNAGTERGAGRADRPERADRTTDKA